MICWDADIDAGISAKRGWRWPTGADHGLVIVSFDAYARGCWTIACASTGDASAADKITAKPARLKLIIKASSRICRA
jgi:threonine synthase